MRAVQAISVLAFAAQALAHGYVYRITADNTVYPGWDVRVDPLLRPTPARIAFGGGNVGPMMNMSSPDMACSRNPKPAPGAIAEVRAGSNMTFYWSHWLYSHKGPMTAWMAPYKGNIAEVKVNDLEFFKISEDTVDENGVWGTVRMMDKTNHTWTATIPADVKPGTYVIRQEIISLHFNAGPSEGYEFAGTGPQFYFTCFNVKVTGNGTATPKGEKFPGAYKPGEPAWTFNLTGSVPFVPAGPPVYKSAYNVKLTPKEVVVLSPTGQGKEADDAYYKWQEQSLNMQYEINTRIDADGG